MLDAARRGFTAPLGPLDQNCSRCAQGIGELTVCDTGQVLIQILVAVVGAHACSYLSGCPESTRSVKVGAILV